MADTEKFCPIIGNECMAGKCKFWCGFAEECAVPLLASMFADSSVCLNIFHSSDK